MLSSLRRCAQLRGSAVAPQVAARLQPFLVRSLERPSAAAPRVTTIRHNAPVSRWYSAEAAATPEPAQSTDPTRFDELATLGVHENLIRAITQGMGYQTMSDVQSKTITPALKGMDLVAQARTGTGKTLGFLVPVLQRMLMEDPSLATRSARRGARADDIRGIVLSPTRELAEQIAVEAEKLTAGTGLVVQRAVGGTQKREMLSRTRRQGCHLLVATPGRLNDLLSDPSTGIAAPNLAAIVLDEADRMLDVGFKTELEDIVDKLPDTREKARQTLLYSATIPKDVVQLARQWVRPDNFDFVQTVNKNEALTHDRVKQQIVACKGWANVFPALFEVLEKEIEKRRADPDSLPFKALVFLPATAIVDVADRTYFASLGRSSRVRGYKIHSKLTQAQRTRAADMFRAAQSGILFSSDVTARGMDFPNVTHVIQVGAPQEREQYVHRLGRTGRQDKDGEGWVLVPQSDLSTARQVLGGLPIQPNRDIESAQYDVLSNDPVRPKVIDNTMEALKTNVLRTDLAAAYRALFANVSPRTAAERAEELKTWFVDGMGFNDTPTFPASTMAKLGLRGIRDINTSYNPEFEDNSGGRFERGPQRGLASRSRGDFGGSRRDAPRRPRDPFASMEERDNRPRGRSRAPAASF